MSFLMTAPTREAVRGPSGPARPAQAPRPVLVPAMALSAGYSPRHTPLDDSHVEALMEVMDQLPPIVVHRPTMTVIDGAHRLEAARRAGRAKVAALFFDGSEDEALVLAVRANVAHGKPLTLGERRGAGAALLARFPGRSDRWIGHICGLSHSTVARLRSACPCPQGEEEAGAVRTGMDGRRRALGGPGVAAGSTGPGRAGPDGAFRRPSGADGPGRFEGEERGEGSGRPNGAAGPGGRGAAELGPSCSPRRTTGERGTGHAPAAGSGTPPTSSAPGILGDAALTSSPEMAGLLAWLERTAVERAEMEPFLAALPVSRTYDLADECRRRGRTWMAIADDVEHRGGHRPG